MPTDNITFIVNGASGSIYPFGDMSKSSLHLAYDKIAQIKRSQNVLGRLTPFHETFDSSVIDTSLDKYAKIIRTAWLPHDYSILCKYVIATNSEKSGKRVRLVKTADEYAKSKENYYDDDFDLKIKYLLKQFFTDNRIVDFMYRFMEKYPFVSWISMDKHTDTLRDFIRRRVEKEIRFRIKNR